MSVPAAETEVFFGRARELAELRGWLRAARDGANRLVAVEGEAGIGKTRLVEELLKVARSQGVPVRVGRAREDANGTPLWPWRRADPRAGHRGRATACVDQGRSRRLPGPRRHAQ